MPKLNKYTRWRKIRQVLENETGTEKHKPSEQQKAKRRQQGVQKAKKTRVRRQSLAEKFKKYRPGESDG